MQKILLASALIVIAAAGSARATGGAHAAHAAHATHTPHPVPTEAKPRGGWTTDAPLRAGMAGIRRSVEALDHYRHGHMGPDQALVVVGNIEKDVAGIVANCKLDPAADAALHAIIARLIRSAAALRARPADLAAIEPMGEALAEYGRSFDDPAFRAPAR